jgi:hypothetical protein
MSGEVAVQASRAITMSGLVRSMVHKAMVLRWCQECTIRKIPVADELESDAKVLVDLVYNVASMRVDCAEV